MLSTSELFCSDDLPHELRPLLAAHHPWEILTALDGFVERHEALDRVEVGGE